MKLVRQPDKTTCGQASVATICGITLEEACTLAGTKGKTSTKQLKRILRAMSVNHDDRRTRGFPPDDVTALLYWRSTDWRSHWMVWHKKKYYDPIAGVFRDPPRWLADARVTSYLRVYL